MTNGRFHCQLLLSRSGGASLIFECGIKKKSRESLTVRIFSNTDFFVIKLVKLKEKVIAFLYIHYLLNLEIGLKPFG
jgi:hypothetical protein